MSEGANSGPGTARELTDAERSLLALVREGRMDAEIAVRLGLPTSEVKARIEQLCAKLGARDRAALRDGIGAPTPTPGLESPSGTTTRHRNRWPLVTAASIALVALVVLGAWLVTRDSQSAIQASPTATPFVAAQATASAQLAAVTPRVVPTPDTTVIAGRQMYDLGKMFVVSNHVFNAIDHVDTREAMTVVYLAGPGVVRANGSPAVQWNYAGASSFTTYVGGQTISLAVNPTTQDLHTHFVFGDSDSIAFYNDAGGLPAVILQATTSGINVSWYVTVNASGELFLATAPTPPDAVIDQTTGALLVDRSSPIRPSLVSLGTADVAFTACDITAPPSRCYAIWRSTSVVRAPTDGYASCDTSGRGTFTSIASGWKLEFTPAIPGAEGCKAQPRTLLKAGDEMSEASHYEITASDSAGPLSVGVALGQLYVGDFVDPVGCPCIGSDSDSPTISANCDVNDIYNRPGQSLMCASCTRLDSLLPPGLSRPCGSRAAIPPGAKG